MKAGTRAAERMKALRTRLGLSQAELGERLNTSGNMVGFVETGRCGISNRLDAAMRHVEDRG